MRITVVISLLILCMLAAMYGSTFSHIASICWHDDAYSHGLLLPFVAAYVLHDRWFQIRAALGKNSRDGRFLPGSFLGGALTVIGLFFFLVGEASDSLYLEWISFYPVVSGILLLVAGRDASRLIIPPVLLLFLAKPLPDSVVPRLFSPFQNLAARVSARTLEAFHVPVHVVGNIIEIPTMRLQVEEACSGMRSLMALLCVAVIVCLLIRMPRFAKLFVIILAVITAMALNVFRVALTGVLAHFVSPQAASGFFHTFSGWIVFVIGLGIVYSLTALMLRILSKRIPTERAPSLAASGLHFSHRGALLSLIFLLVATTGFYGFHDKLTGGARPYDAPVESLPLNFGGWTGRDVEGLGIRPLDILKLSRYIRRAYTDAAGNEVLVYVGYWTKQSGEHQAAKHSPRICLPSNGWATTFLPREKLVASDGKTLKVNRVIGGVGTRALLFQYWFFSGETTYTDEWEALVRISFETFFHGRSDGGIVELTTELKDLSNRERSTTEADQILRGFSAVFYPELAKLLHPAR